MVINREDIVFPEARGVLFDILVTTCPLLEETGCDRAYGEFRSKRQPLGVVGY